MNISNKQKAISKKIKTYLLSLISYRLSHGFTLIELIIVIAIIGVLAGAIIFIMDPAKQLKKARDGQRKADLGQIQSALEIYRSDIGNYPTSSLLNCPASGTKTYFGSPAYSGNTACTSTYLKNIPTDPKNIGKYIYTYSSSDGKTYSLIACLENVNDAQKDSSNNSLCDGETTNWSYTVSNP